MTDLNKKVYKRVSKENPNLSFQEKLALCFRQVDALTDRLIVTERRVERKHGRRAAYAFSERHIEEWRSWHELYHWREMGYISTRF